jgi:hypothetical protein
LLLYAPLVGHVAPTLIIGFGFVIPGSPIEGINTYTIGFLSAVLGFIPAYVAGVAIATRLPKPADGQAEGSTAKVSQ